MLSANKSEKVTPIAFANIDSLTFRDWWHLLARYTSTIDPDDSVHTALRIIAHRGFRHLPLASERRLYGIVTAGDLMDTFTSLAISPLKDGGKLQVVKSHSDHILDSLNFKVKTIASSTPVTVEPENTILDGIEKVSHKNTGSLLIVGNESSQADILEKSGLGKTPVSKSANGSRLEGIVTLRDIVSILAAYGPFGVKVEDCMTEKVYTIGENDHIFTAMTLMSRERIRRLPVVARTRNNESGESLVGMVTNKMILRYLESVLAYGMLDLGNAILQPVRTIMNSSIPTIDPKEDCGNAAYLIRELGTGGFAVLDSRELVGTITERDLVKRIYERKGLSFFSQLFRMGNQRAQV